MNYGTGKKRPYRRLSRQWPRSLSEMKTIDSFLLVSDMLQNTSLWNEYDGEATPSAEAIAGCGRITRAGRLRDLYVFYIDRNIAAQSNGWPTDRWRVCLEGIETTTIN